MDVADVEHRAVLLFNEFVGKGHAVTPQAVTNPLERGVSGISGMECWNGMEHWNGIAKWFFQ